MTIKACVFDAYGTLFDVHAATRHHAAELGADSAEISLVWRNKQLQYTWLRSLMGRYVDFWQITADALDYALEEHGVDAPETRQRLLDAYLQLDTYEEVSTVLTELKDMRLKCAILSNGSPHMLSSAVAAAGLDGLLDEVLSVDDIGIFKPDPRVYQLAVDGLGVAADEIIFQSSNAWDAVGAASFGFQVAWVNRFSQPAERLGHQPQHEITDLTALPALCT